MTYYSDYVETRMKLKGTTVYFVKNLKYLVTSKESPPNFSFNIHLMQINSQLSATVALI